MKNIKLIVITILAIWGISTAEAVFLMPSSPVSAHTYADSSSYACPKDTYYLEHYYGYSPSMFRFDMAIDYSDYDNEKNNTTFRSDCLFNNCIALTDSSNAYVCKIAEFINRVCMGDEDISKAYYVMQFMERNIYYNTDRDIYASDDYWATPVETLYLRTGDCEDRSILACSILYAMGLESALLIFPEHVAPAVIIDETVYSLDASKSYPNPNLSFENHNPDKI